MWRKPWLKWQLAHECKLSPLQTWLLHCQRQQESNVHALTGVPEWQVTFAYQQSFAKHELLL